jgi:Domain of unknown function (DUF6798)
VIYVFERLPHHLVIHAFEPNFILRHLALLAAWLLLCYWTRGDAASTRLRRFVLATIVIAIAGALIDLATMQHPELAARLLRYYWYRLSDVMLPVGTALAIAVLLVKLQTSRPMAGQWLLVAAMLAAIANIGDIFYQRSQDLCPPADLNIANVDDWRRACNWIATYTRPEDRFLTPFRQQTFKWYAGRSEVVTYKDMPQDAPGIVDWFQRRQDLYDAAGRLPQRTGMQWGRLARQYDFQYIVIERTAENAQLPFLQVYPGIFEDNAAYAIYRLPQLEKADIEQAADP